MYLNLTSPSPCRLFYGHWPDKNGRGLTTLVVEQVSHHPPITAYYIANKSRGITLQGHSAQKTSFSGELFPPWALVHVQQTCPRPSGGNIIVKQLGHATLTVSLPNGNKEDYLITLPRLRIEGLWYGSPYIELAETSYIQSSSGWLSTIKYQGKGYFSGKSHTFKADLTPPIGAGSAFKSSSFEGQWNTTSKDTRTSAVFTDVNGPKEEVTVRPVEDQGEWESRALWCKVAKGIRESDFDTAAREKGRIEVHYLSPPRFFLDLSLTG
jgi:oxysterol-binding protein-related protein 9/10/11